MKMLMAANWKMFKTASEAQAMIRALSAKLGGVSPKDSEIVLFTPFTCLRESVEAISSALPDVAIGAQNIYPALEGAFTGEISPNMLKDCGATWVLIGHSERRHILGESNAFVGQKTAFALACGLKTIMCVGETLAERERGDLAEVLEYQLYQGLGGITEIPEPDCLAIAYEPVWAIGTGKRAAVSDIVDAHALIRELTKQILGHAGLLIRIIYGGSVKPENAGEILALDNVDGVLVGGASLQADSYHVILTANIR